MILALKDIQITYLKEQLNISKIGQLCAKVMHVKRLINFLKIQKYILFVHKIKAIGNIIRFSYQFILKLWS